MFVLWITLVRPLRPTLCAASHRVQACVIWRSASVTRNPHRLALYFSSFARLWLAVLSTLARF